MPRGRWPEEEITWVSDRYGIKRGVVKPKVEMSRPGVCSGCRQQFDIDKVEVIAHYADCSVWLCPHCGIVHDDRQRWGASPEYRMGYVDLVRQADGIRERMAEGWVMG